MTTAAGQMTTAAGQMTTAAGQTKAAETEVMSTVMVHGRRCGARRAPNQGLFRP